MDASRTDLLPYYLICKACSWEAWVEESDWLKTCSDHIELSTTSHNSIITFGSTIKYTSAVIEGVTGAKYRDLFVE
jgi:hypothetical protein